MRTNPEWREESLRGGPGRSERRIGEACAATDARFCVYTTALRNDASTHNTAARQTALLTPAYSIANRQTPY